MPGVQGMELGFGQVVQVVPHVRFGKERLQPSELKVMVHACPLRADIGERWC
jgi:hypothetical protein